MTASEQQENNQIKNDLKHHEALIHLLDKKADRLEQGYNYQHEQLDKIEQNVNKISEMLFSMKKNLDEHNGAANAKGKINHNIYMWLTFLVLLVGNDAFWNYWKGLNGH